MAQNKVKSNARDAPLAKFWKLLNWLWIKCQLFFCW